jgi:hypothetical protein
MRMGLGFRGEATRLIIYSTGRPLASHGGLGRLPLPSCCSLTGRIQATANLVLPGRAARRVVLEAHARLGVPGRAGTGPLNSVPGHDWAEPKTRAFGRATGSRAFWTSVATKTYLLAWFFFNTCLPGPAGQVISNSKAIQDLLHLCVVRVCLP